MSRAFDMLQRLKVEIQNDPTATGYAGRTPAEIAVRMSQPISFPTPQFRTVSPDVVEVLRSKLTPVRKQKLLDFLKAQGWIVDAEVADQQVEVTTRRCDLLSFGDVSQGDVEQALLA